MIQKYASLLLLVAGVAASARYASDRYASPNEIWEYQSELGALEAILARSFKNPPPGSQAAEIAFREAKRIIDQILVTEQELTNIGRPIHSWRAQGGNSETLEKLEHRRESVEITHEALLDLWRGASLRYSVALQVFAASDPSYQF